MHCGGRGTSGREQVVSNNHALAFLDGVLMNLQRVAAVFEIVTDACSFCRKLSGFAHGNEAGIQTIGESWTENKAAGFHAEDQVNILLQVVLGKRVDQCGESQPVF